MPRIAGPQRLRMMAAPVAYGPYKDRSLQIGNIILAAHAGGGTYMRKLATSNNSTAANVRECWGFDSLYNSSDVMPWRGRSRMRRDALYSIAPGWPR